MMKIDYAHVFARMSKHIAMPQYSTPHHSTMVTVKLRSNCGGDHDITASWGTTLREVQEQVCMLYHKPFPTTKACICSNGKTYDEFVDKPFWGCTDKTVFGVEFMQTDDPYFYDLRGRRGPQKPKIELELMLVSEPFDLPPPAEF